MPTDETNQPYGECSPDSIRDNFLLVCSDYSHEMRVKAKTLVRGVRQMSCNEIPDIWKMAVRRFSRVQSMPSCR